jgi:polysaccharide pyruvyl transferase WcaK-like protein
MPDTGVGKRSMNSDSKLVYLCGAGGKGNIGAEAIALSIIKLFQRRYRHVRFIVSAWYPVRMRELLSRLPGDFTVIKQERLLDNPIAIARADFFVICGDVSISESVVSFLPLYYALRTATANLVARSVIFLGIEAEKLRRRSNIWSLKWLVDRPSNVLLVRNEESFSNINHQPIQRALMIVGTELALTLNKEELQGFDDSTARLSPSKLRVGFGIRDHFTQPFRVDFLRRTMTRRDEHTVKTCETMERILEFTARIADYMAEKHDAQIVFVPHHYLPQNERVIRPDSEIAQMIIERLRVAKDVVIVEDSLHPFTVINLYGRLDMVFSMRHHTNAFAYLNHVPAFGYGIYDKIDAFFKQMGHEDMLLDPLVTDMANTYARIDTAVRDRASISHQIEMRLALLRNRMSTALDVALNHR